MAPDGKCPDDIRAPHPALTTHPQASHTLHQHDPHISQPPVCRPYHYVLFARWRHDMTFTPAAAQRGPRWRVRLKTGWVVWVVLVGLGGAGPGRHDAGPSAALLDKRCALHALPRLGALSTLDLRGNDLKATRLLFRGGITYIAQVLKRNRTLKVSENKLDVGCVAMVERPPPRPLQDDCLLDMPSSDRFAPISPSTPTDEHPTPASPEPTKPPPRPYISRARSSSNN
ncbi:hypothetical protein H0H92_015989 [Tricholoma furcatifolium]|nr:hypothetical protein H0H92_015989 [Tricholoma furcatifolium]